MCPQENNKNCLGRKRNVEEKYKWMVSYKDDHKNNKTQNKNNKL